jgi:histidinol-phosphate aminotransferase
MSWVLNLVREDLRGFAGYSSARKAKVTGDVWLNANESPWLNAADAAQALNRYPEPQPQALRERMAQLYQVNADQLLIGRGSDELIDILVRALCNPAQDAVVHTPPVFGMYAVSARLQNAKLIDVPLVDNDNEFALDEQMLLSVIQAGTCKIVFLCSPANPTGRSIPRDQLLRILQAAAQRCMVVVDEAYIDFADQTSITELLNQYPHLAVLKTLSKAHGLAAARIGCLIADADLIKVLRNCQAPYPVPKPCSAIAVEGLSAAALEETRERISLTKNERKRLYSLLSQNKAVRKVYTSDANFILVRFYDAEAAFQSLLSNGVVVRDVRAMPQLNDALRITIGTPEENDRVIEALNAIRVAA